jgi:hypothetical protein
MASPKPLKQGLECVAYDGVLEHALLLLNYNSD